MRETPPLFTYGTGVSLRTPDRHASRLPLVIGLLLLLTAALAALVLAAFLWLATADYSALLGAARDLLQRFLASA